MVNIQRLVARMILHFVWGATVFARCQIQKYTLINSNPSICHDICDSKEVAQYLCL